MTSRTNESETIPRITRSNHGNQIDLAKTSGHRHRGHGDLTGRTFGFWFVKGMGTYGLTAAGDKVKMWDCRCRCGYRKRIRTYALTSGQSKSCGCHALDVRRVREDLGYDLTGETFDRWVVIGKAENRTYRSGFSVRQWLCRCSCGTEKPVLASSLRQGKSRSCGCLRQSNPNRASQAVDRTGSVFGRLEVTGRDDDWIEEGGRVRIRWKCRCQCGNEVSVSLDNLLGGRTRSCGCARKHDWHEARRLARLRRQVAAVDAAF